MHAAADDYIDYIDYYYIADADAINISALPLISTAPTTKP
jgi:hypothetical protein